MPELLTPELIELRDKVEQMGREILVPLWFPDTAKQGDSESGFDLAERHRQTIEASKAANVFPMTQPREFGGRGATMLELTVVRDTLGSLNLSHIPSVFGPGPGVLSGAEEPLRSTHLAPLMAGEKRSAFGFTEPDKVDRATWGRLEGDTLLVNGQKSYVTGGADADFVNTLVEVEGHGPAMVVIDTDKPGVSIRDTFGSVDGSHHAYMEFKDVAVPATHIIGKPGEGIPRALGQIGDTRLAFAAESVGLARWVIDFVTEHLEAPHRSGQPLGSREGVRLRYADLRIKAYAARSMVYRTARLADAGENIINEGIACKVFSTEMVGDVVDWGIQLIGGIALRTGHPLEKLYRRVRILRLAEGASDVLRINLAKGRLELDKGRI